MNQFKNKKPSDGGVQLINDSQASMWVKESLRRIARRSS